MKVRNSSLQHQPLNLEDFFSKMTFTTLLEDFSDKENHMYRAQHEHQFTGDASEKVQISLSDAFNKIWNAPEDSGFIQKIIS
jgi:hypothetical protein